MIQMKNTLDGKTSEQWMETSKAHEQKKKAYELLAGLYSSRANIESYAANSAAYISKQLDRLDQRDDQCLTHETLYSIAKEISDGIEELDPAKEECEYQEDEEECKCPECCCHGCEVDHASSH